MFVFKVKKNMLNEKYHLNKTMPFIMAASTLTAINNTINE